MRSVDSTVIPPEFEKASKIISKRLESHASKPIYQKLSSQMWLKSGTSSVIRKKPKIRDIPSGNGWRWNQAKRRYHITNDKLNLSFEILKLVPRRCVRSHLKTLPTLKLWQACICNKKTPLTIFWCERGVDSMDIYQQQEFVPESQESIEISDFLFLARFMHPSHAQQIWPNELGPEMAPKQIPTQQPEYVPQHVPNEISQQMFVHTRF